MPELYMKYADTVNRTIVVIFLMLFLAHIELPGLHKEICWWESNQRSFVHATPSTRSNAWAR